MSHSQHIVLVAFSLAGPLSGQNLIINGSNDEPLIGGEIPGWTEAVGTTWSQRCEDPPPYDGACYFFAGAVVTAKLEQNILVDGVAAGIDSGTQPFRFQGAARAWGQSPPDQANIIFRFLDALGDTLGMMALGPYSDVNAWEEIDTSFHAPPGTRIMNLALRSDRLTGSNNDGYYDGLVLTTESTISIHEGSSPPTTFFPNPTTGPVTLTRNNAAQAGVLLLYDALGQLVVERTVRAGEGLITLDLSGQPTGIYVVTLRSNEGGREMVRILKQ